MSFHPNDVARRARAASVAVAVMIVALIGRDYMGSMSPARNRRSRLRKQGRVSIDFRIVPNPIVIAYHLIWTAYGWWLPNDPRGSMSRCIASDVIAELGELH